MKFARYTPSRQRPKGTGAFFDYAISVLTRDAQKLKSCRIDRQWGKGANAAPSEARAKELDPAT